VPQGSVLCPLLFTIFIGEIHSVLERHPVKYVLYADNIQLYVKCKVSEMSNAMLTMESCLDEVQQWITSVGLILNPTKTEFIIFAGKSNLHATVDVGITVDGVRIMSKPHVRNLGVTLDSALTLEKHVVLVRKAAFSHL
jgi:hypothetical protein